MRARVLAIVVGVAATALLASLSAAPRSRPRARTHTVTIEDMAFVPRTLEVAKGDTIVWTNKDLVPHTATSKSGGFDSQTLRTEASWSYTATRTGTFEYLCTFHPTMAGTVRVR